MAALKNLTVAMGGAVASGLEDYRNLNYSIVANGHHHGNGTIHRTQLPGDRVPGLVNGSGLLNTTEVYPYDFSIVPNCFMENGSDFGCNETLANMTAEVPLDTSLPLWQIIFLGTLAGITSIMTILGNLVVILSFVLERQIRQPTNYFIASLAVSDLLIGSLSMPFYTVYLLAGQMWPLGEVICDLWLSVDYTVCLTSIYTVFCITIDRFCSVKIPAKYRNWRTDRKVLIMIASTWIIPVGVFFTSIFGWQYFTDGRTVPDDKCYVQYMDDALFNCILQVGYFWITLVVMCVLYTGIYKVALTLQKKSDAKHKKMTSLVSMAGQTMTQIGIGMSQQKKALEAKKLFPENGNTVSQVNNTGTTLGLTTENAVQQGTSTTSFSSSKNNDKEEDRSSSPAFPSDTEPSSSQSPKRSPKPKKSTHKKTKHKANSSGLAVPKLAPPKSEKRIYKMERHLPNAIASNGAHGLNSLGALPLPQVYQAQNSRGQQQQQEQEVTSAKEVTPPQSESKVSPTKEGENNEERDPVLTANDTSSLHSEPEKEALLQHGYENPALLHNLDNASQHCGSATIENDEPSASDAIATSPELLAGVKYIDQDSIKSLQSNDNIKQLLLEPKLSSSAAAAEEITEEPESPIWKKRTSFFQEDEEEEGCGEGKGGSKSPDSPAGSLNSIPPPPQPPTYSQVCPPIRVRGTPSPQPDKSPTPPKASPETKRQSPCEKSGRAIPPPINICHNQPVTATASRGRGSPPLSPASDISTPPAISPANIQVHTTDSSSKPVSTLAKAEEVKPLNANKESSRNSSVTKKEKRLAALKVVPYIRSMRKSKKSRKKDKNKQSKSENRARKALRTITIILGAFVLCWTPWHILSLIIGFVTNPHGSVMVLYDISYWLCYLNSPINPFCYAFANQQFKKTFIRILKLDWHRT